MLLSSHQTDIKVKMNTFIMHMRLFLFTFSKYLDFLERSSYRVILKRLGFGTINWLKFSINAIVAIHHITIVFCNLCLFHLLSVSSWNFHLLSVSTSTHSFFWEIYMTLITRLYLTESPCDSTFNVLS